MRRSIPAIIGILAILAVAPPLLGQGEPLDRGMLLRVRTRGIDMEGNLVRLSSDTLVLWTGGQSTAGARPLDRAIALTEVDRLQAGTPRSAGRGAGRGALWGAAVGSLLGVLAGMAMDTDCFLCPSSRQEALTIGVIGLGGVGTAVGSLVGLAFPGTRWEDTTLEPLPSPAPESAP